MTQAGGENFTERFKKSFDGKALDGTRLAADIASSKAGSEANKMVQMQEWRDDLHRRVRARRAAQPLGTKGGVPLTEEEIEKLEDPEFLNASKKISPDD